MSLSFQSTQKLARWLMFSQMSACKSRRAPSGQVTVLLICLRETEIKICPVVSFYVSFSVQPALCRKLPVLLLGASFSCLLNRSFFSL